MARAIEVAFAVLFFLGALTFLAYQLWFRVHKTLRKEQKQDEIDRSIKW